MPDQSDQSDQSDQPDQPDGSDRPTLRIVRGDPTPEEVAALVAVVTAVSAAGADDEPRRRPAWSAPHRQVRAPLPSSWRASALPR